MDILRIITVLFLIVKLSICTCFGQDWTQLGQDIEGASFNEQMGDYSSMNASGTRAAVSAALASGAKGRTRIYEWDGTSWSQMGMDIVGEAFGDQSGSSLSMNSLGDWVAIGAPDNDGVGGSNTGHVRVYRWLNSAWTQVGADLEGIAPNDLFGTSVSLNASGTLMAIGAPGNDVVGSNDGQCYIYEWNGSSWSQKGFAINGESSGDQSGGSISINKMGTLVAIGAKYNGGNGTHSGHVRVFELDGFTWVQVGQDIDGENAGDNSGNAISLDSAGNRIAIGADLNGGNGTSSGHVKVYEWNDTSALWTIMGGDMDGESHSDRSGRDVALNATGDIVAIGAPFNDSSGASNFNSGHVRIYQWNGSAWNQLGLDIDAMQGANSGTTVQLNATGDRVAMSAPKSSGSIPSSGQLRVFTINICFPSSIITHPSNVTMCPGGQDFFYSDTSPTGSVDSLRWIYSDDAGATWAPLADTGAYIGSTTIFLDLNEPEMGLNGRLHRMVSYFCDSLSDSSQSAILTLVDSVPPVASCPSNLTTFALSSFCDDFIFFNDPSATDNCGIANTTQLSGIPNLNDFPIGNTLQTFVFTDYAGNSDTCSFMITVLDTHPPFVLCPINANENGQQGSNSTAVNGLELFFVSDGCNIMDTTFQLTGATVGSGVSDASGITFSQGVTFGKYIVSDASNNKDSCTFTVNINGYPVAVADTVVFTEDTTNAIINVQVNDTDPDLDPLLTFLISSPTSGGFADDLNFDSIIYTPPPNFAGLDTLIYEVCDQNLLCDSDSVFIFVLNVNDPPEIDTNGILTDTIIQFTTQGSSFNYCVSVSDSDMDAYIVDTLVGPSNGTYTQLGDSCFTYAHNGNPLNTDSLILIVCDTGTPSACDTVVLLVRISPTADFSYSNTLSAAHFNEFAQSYGTLISFFWDFGDGFTSTMANPTHTYSASGNYSVCLTVSDQYGTSTICNLVNIVGNLAPSSFSYTDTLNEDQVANYCVLAIDPEGHAYTIDTLLAPGQGAYIKTSDSCFNYFPNPNFYGLDSIIISVCDTFIPSACGTVNLYINIQPVNDPPIAQPDSISLPQDTFFAYIDVQHNDFDVDNSSPSTTIIFGPSSGSFATVINGDSIQYSSSLGFMGMDTIVYQLCDNNACDTTTLLINVLPCFPPFFTLGPDSILCPGQTLTLDAGSGVYGFQWQDNSSNQTFTVSSPGIYWVDKSDINSCSLRDSITILLQPSVNTELTGFDSTGYCEGDTLLLTPKDLGYSLEFDGFSNLIVDSSAFLPQGNSPRTIEAWIKTNSQNIGSIIYWGSSDSTEASALYAWDGYLVFHDEKHFFVSSRFIADGEWTHVAAVTDGTQIKLYINGYLDGAFPFTTQTSGSEFAIGNGLPPFTLDYFEGEIGEVRIWEIARNQSELLANMYEGPTGNTPGLVHYWELNEGLGSPILIDSTGNLLPISILPDMNPNNVWNSAHPGITHVWEWGDGSLDTILTGQHIYANSGSFNGRHRQILLNGCETESSFTPLIHSIPFTSFSGLPNSICGNDPPLTLTGNLTTGQFFGSVGLEDLNNGISLFDPLQAGPGAHNISFTDSSNAGCISTHSLSTFINQNPVVSIAPIPSQMQLTDLPLFLSGTPSGGAFSGLGVDSISNTFDPRVAGQGGHLISYSTINAFGCVGTDTVTIQIHDSATAFIAGLARGYCASDQTDYFLFGNPNTPPGTFWGPGVDSLGIFNPDKVPATGLITIHYAFQDGNLLDTVSANTIIYPTPIVDFQVSGTYQYCENAQGIDLSQLVGVSPVGGTFVFSGNGVTDPDSIFDPSVAGPGSHSLQAIYSDSNSCVSTDSQIVKVWSLGTATIPGFLPQYCPEDTVHLSGLPIGGTFSGSGITNNSFIPENAGGGFHSILYETQDTNNCTVSISETTLVLSTTDPDLNFLPDTLCSNANPITLSGLPPGGTFTGNGITDSIIGIFAPSLATQPKPRITYTIVDNNGCTIQTRKNVVLIDSLAATFSGLNSTYCLLDAGGNLTGTPLDGSFFGPGIFGDSTIFFPQLAGSGTHSITYTPSENERCVSPSSQTVMVSQNPAITLSANTTTFAITTSNQIQAFTGSPSGGLFYPHPGLTDNNDGTADFDPSVAGIGPHTIFYSANVGGCDNLDSVTVNIFGSGQTGFSGLSSEYCQSDSNAYLLQGFPPGGTFEGDGIQLGSNQFVPSHATTGIITLTYITANNDTNLQQTHVFPSPTVYFDTTAIQLCLSNPPLELSNNVSPQFGIFSGSGISGTLFDPVQAGVGSHLIEYRALENHPSGLTCSNQTPAIITVNPVPQDSLNLMDNYCVNDSSVNLSVHGNWDTVSYIGFNVTQGIFYPNHGSGQGEIKFSLKDAGGCMVTLIDTVTVHATPTINDFFLAQDYCLNEDTVTAAVNPNGGVYSGGNLINNQFLPADFGIGNFNLTYTFTNSFGCKAARSRNFNILGLPSVQIDANVNDQFCEADQNVILLANPSGGYWSGNGIVKPNQGLFSPVVADAGNHLLTFSYDDPTSGCTNSDSLNVLVNPLPIVSLSGLDSSYCKVNDSIFITGAPIGGTFSGPGIFEDSLGAYFFNPEQVSLSPAQITYAYIDSNGCQASINSQVKSIPLPIGLISGLDNTYCEEDGPSNLNGIVYSGNAGGFFGPGIDSIAPDKAVFNPDSAQEGIKTIVFTLYSADSVCTFQETAMVRVDTNPVVTFDNLSASYCEDENAVLLRRSPDPDSVVGTGNFSSIFSAATQKYYLPSVAAQGSPNLPSIDTLVYTFTDSNGCAGSQTQTTVIHPLPNPTTSGLNGTYCLNDVPTPLFGDTTLPTLIANFNGPGCINDTFVPLFAGPGQHEILYFVQDSNSCIGYDTLSTTVNALPNLSFISVQENFCEGDTGQYSLPVNISGGIYAGPGITNPNIGSFRPDSAGVGSHTISYTLTDTATGCTDSINMVLTVRSLPPAVITSLPTPLCENDQNVTLVGFPQIGSGLFSGGFFIGPNDSIYNNNFDPRLVGPGQHEITFEVKEIHGGETCISTVSDSILVLGLPNVQFSSNTNCTNNPVHFTDLTQPYSQDTIQGWLWAFGADGNSTDQNPSFIFPQSGTKQVTLTVTTSLGCTKSFQQNIIIGDAPSISFDWERECFGDQTRFLFDPTSTDSTLTFLWQISDGNSYTNRNPSHTFMTQGSHTVNLSVSTDSGCTVTESATILIRPVITVAPNQIYFEDFQNGKAWWAPARPKHGQNSWEWGSPDKSFIKVDTVLPDRVWVTKVSENYSNNEFSIVESPCFNLDGLIRPMVRFDRISSLQNTLDGVKIQISKDAGVTWDSIGEVASGVHWYNKSGIGALQDIATASNQGWSSQEDWKNARHRLDEFYSPGDTVRFRFVLGTSPFNVDDGFAFDNFTLENRNKTILTEYFPSSGNNNQDPTDLTVNQLINSNPRDVVGLQYHLDPNNPMYLQNQADASARQLYNQALSPPWVVMDGNQYKNHPNGNGGISFGQGLLNKRMLETANFDIEVQQPTVGLVGVAYNASAIYIGDSLFSDPITFHLAIIERKIQGVYGNYDSEWVMKKMIPTPGGRLVSKVWAPGDTIQLSNIWTFSTAGAHPQQIYANNEVGLIAFIVNDSTGEILQAGYNGPAGPLTSIDEVAQLEKSFEIFVFPNPAQDQLNVWVEDKNIEKVRLIDLHGKVLDEQDPQTNQALFEVATLTQGLYFLEITIEGKSISRKVIISR